MIKKYADIINQCFDVKLKPGWAVVITLLVIAGLGLAIYILHSVGTPTV